MLIACCCTLLSCGDDPTLPAASPTPASPDEAGAEKRPRSRWRTKTLNKEFRTTSPSGSVRIARRYVDVPVLLPSLPAGTKLVGRKPLSVTRVAGVWDASLRLDLPGMDSLQIIWGRAGFDGCGGDDAIAVRVAGHPGLIDIDRVTKRTFVGQLIWPADKETLEGTYGLYLQGPVNPRADLLRLAKSMTPRQQARSPEPTGC